jgi:hypothetical protein
MATMNRYFLGCGVAMFLAGIVHAELQAPVKPDVQVTCVSRDGLCEVIRLGDDRHATVQRADVLAYLTNELRLPLKSTLGLVAMTDDFFSLKLQMQSAGYLVSSSVEIGVKARANN